MTPNIDVSITLTPEVRLKQALKQAGIEALATVAKLIVAGALTEKNITRIRDNINETTLHELDMDGVSVKKTKFQTGLLKAVSVIRQFGEEWYQALDICVKKYSKK